MGIRRAQEPPAATVCPASQRDRVLLERAANPLHRAGVNSKLFGYDADTELRLLLVGRVACLL